jgi:hypothetical protein
MSPPDQTPAPITLDTCTISATTTDGLITILVTHGQTQLAELKLPVPSDEPQALLSTLTLEGIDLALYQSSIDDHLVLDVLTETPSPIQHDEQDRALLRITVNDDEVFDA